MTPRESLQTVLPPAEYERIIAALKAHPANTVYTTWIASSSAVLVVPRLDGEVTGYLLTPAPDAIEGEEIAAAIGRRLVAEYAGVRDAREAARLLIKRLMN